MVKQPVISKELIAYLDQAFPTSVPEAPVDNPHQLNALIGQRQVVEHLRGLYAQQEEDSYV